jgi:hypothetical protein
MRNVIWLVFTRGGTVAFIFLVCWWAYDYFGPRKQVLAEECRAAANEVIPTIVDDLARNRGDIRSLAVLQFDNDPTDFVTATLYERLGPSGAFDLQDRTLGEKAREAARFQHPSFGDAASAIEEGRAREVDGVVFGVVRELSIVDGDATVDLQVNLADVRTGTTIFSSAYTRADAVSSSSSPEVIRRISWWKRFLMWTVAILMLPVFTIAFLRTMVAKQSNASNALVLTLYTFVAVVLAILLIGFNFSSLWSLLALALCAGAAFIYNVFMMTCALRMEET